MSENNTANQEVTEEIPQTSKEEKFFGVKHTIEKTPKEESAEELQVEVIDDRPKEDRRPPKVKTKTNEVEEEIDGISDKVQKRIDKIKYDYHEERRAKEASDKLRDEAVGYAKKIQDENKRLSALINKGEELGEEWQLIDERPAFEDESEIQNYFQFASVVTGDGRKKSNQDTDIFRIRYVYTAGRSTEGESREFCRKMMAANKVYRKEDLDKTSKANVDFSPADAKGEGYNIWLYKGGVNCSHYWMRRIYLKKNNKKITVGRARKIISALPQNERKGARFEVNPPEVAQIASARNNYWRKN